MEQELWKYLKTAEKPIALYGMGNGADKIIKVLNERNIPFSGVFASDGFVRNKEFHSHKVTSYADLKEKLGDMIVLLCFGTEREEVLLNIKRIAAEQELYAPDVPVIGSGLFTEEYLYEHKSEYEKIYGMLADELSRKTFENTVRYKLSGKVDYLFECECDRNEPYSEFLRLTDAESFLDLGAYNGDTVMDFVQRVSGYAKITAVEGDEKNFKKLVLNTENLPRTVCKNYCVSSFCGRASFGMKHGRSSAAFSGDKGAYFTTVDSLMGDERVTYIKMDIEGEEKNAVAGAEGTILKYKPKMLISCYHRTEDLVSIPQAVLDIRDDYRIYMRHFRSLPAWDTDYYFI